MPDRGHLKFILNSHFNRIPADSKNVYVRKKALNPEIVIYLNQICLITKVEKIFIQIKVIQI